MRHSVPLRFACLSYRSACFPAKWYSSADNLFLFPGELERMRAPVKEYLTQIFQETSYVEANFLRGIYFCGEVAPPLRHQIIRDACFRERAFRIGGCGGRPLSDQPAGRGSYHRAFAGQPSARAPAARTPTKDRVRSSSARPESISRSQNRQAHPRHPAHPATVGSLVPNWRWPPLSWSSRWAPRSPISGCLISASIVCSPRSILWPAGFRKVRPSAITTRSPPPMTWSTCWAKWTCKALGPSFFRHPGPTRSANKLARHWPTAFSRRVLIAFKNDLTGRVKKAKGTCRPVSMLPQKLSMDVDALARAEL